MNMIARVEAISARYLAPSALLAERSAFEYLREHSMQRCTKRLQPIFELLHRRPHVWLPAPEAARCTHLERRYFSTYFHVHTGYRFVPWQHSIRVIEACRLFMRGRESIQAVAVSVGYSDQSSFARTFRSILGFSATAFVTELGSVEMLDRNRQRKGKHGTLQYFCELNRGAAD